MLCIFRKFMTSTMTWCLASSWCNTYTYFKLGRFFVTCSPIFRLQDLLTVVFREGGGAFCCYTKPSDSKKAIRSLLLVEDASLFSFLVTRAYILILMIFPLRINGDGSKNPREVWKSANTNSGWFWG